MIKTLYHVYWVKTRKINEIAFANSPYNPLTEDEITAYFLLVDTSMINDKTAADLKQHLLKIADKEPYARRLIRDKIKNGEKVIVTQTKSDSENLADGTLGLSYGNERRIS